MGETTIYCCELIAVHLANYGSTWFSVGAQTPGAPADRRSSASNPSSEAFKSLWPSTSVSDVEAFFAGLRFEKRSLLSELLADFLGTTLKQTF